MSLGVCGLLVGVCHLLVGVCRLLVGWVAGFAWFWCFESGSLCSSDRPGTDIPEASASRELGLQGCTTMPTYLCLPSPHKTDFV